MTRVKTNHSVVLYTVILHILSLVLLSINSFGGKHDYLGAGFYVYSEQLVHIIFCSCSENIGLQQSDHVLQRLDVT